MTLFREARRCSVALYVFHFLNSAHRFDRRDLQVKFVRRAMTTLRIRNLFAATYLVFQFRMKNHQGTLQLIAAFVFPVLCLSISIWLSYRFKVFNQDLFIWGCLAASVLIGGYFISKYLNKFPNYQYLILLYLLVLPLALMIYGFFLACGIFGDCL
jgi:hypothetical protein